ncbi:MAG: hypothetical protein ACREXX_24085, partial [Gammaproteobacteria bacterium]
DYQRATKKHGLKTLRGTATEILDPKVFAAAAVGSAAVASVDAFLGFAIGGGLVLSRTVVKVANSFLDSKEAIADVGREIGFILEVKRKFKSSGR